MSACLAWQGLWHILACLGEAGCGKLIKHSLLHALEGGVLQSDIVGVYLERGEARSGDGLTALLSSPGVWHCDFTLQISTNLGPLPYS